MSATTTALPSPQSPWAPGIHTPSSSTPVTLPSKASAPPVGTITNPFFVASDALSARALQDQYSGGSYFGLVVSSPNNSPGPCQTDQIRKNWSQSASRRGSLTRNSPGPSNTASSPVHTPRERPVVKGSAGPNSSSGSSDRENGRIRRNFSLELEGSTERPLLLSTHPADPSWIKRRKHDGDSESNASSFPSQEEAEQTCLRFNQPAEPQTSQIPPSSRYNETTQPRKSNTLAPALPLKSSLGISGVYPLQRSETSPACVDSGGVVIISPQRCAEILDSSLDSTLILDVRPYPRFVQSRIKNSLSLCIPSTLLKRPAFNLKKLEDTFKTDAEREKFEKWHQSTRIIVYDAATNHIRDAAALINVLKKFTNEGWKGEPLILRGGYSQFSSEYPDLIETGENQKQQNLPERPLLPGETFSKAPLVVGGCPLPESSSSINPFFGNIRQNMDLIGGVGQIPIRQPSNMTDKTRHALPPWLQTACNALDKGKSVSEKFFHIEKAEQCRMQDALTGNVWYGTSCRDLPTKDFRIAGVEKGSKNRYNNIYPYDHSRVKLQQISADTCDYVNASFIQSSRSNKRYIATQAPIPTTFSVSILSHRTDGPSVLTWHCFPGF